METPVPVPPLEPQDAAAVAPHDDPSAGLGLRAGAYVIDTVVVMIAGSIVYAVLPGFLGSAVRLSLSLAYSTVLPMVNGGRTLGKMAAGIAIIREDEGPLTYLNTFLRALGYWASSLTLGLGFVCAAFTKHKRGLHDYIAGTRVVRVEEISAARSISLTLLGVILPLLALVGTVAAIARR